MRKKVLLYILFKFQISLIHHQPAFCPLQDKDIAGIGILAKLAKWGVGESLLKFVIIFCGAGDNSQTLHEEHPRIFNVHQ